MKTRMNTCVKDHSCEGKLYTVQVLQPKGHPVLKGFQTSLNYFHHEQPEILISNKISKAMLPNIEHKHLGL